MMQTKRLVLIVFILFTAALALGCWMGYNIYVSRYASYDAEPANEICEGIGVEVDEDLEFASARIEKLKAGPFAIGNLSVLRLKKLSVSYRPVGAKTDSELKKAFQHKMENFAQKFQTRMSRANLSLEGVVAVQIKGLSVYRLDQQGAVLVLSADEAKSRGLSLGLQNCCLYEKGRTNRLGQATISASIDPHLVWSNGERSLSSFIKLP